MRVVARTFALPAQWPDHASCLACEIPPVDERNDFFRAPAFTVIVSPSYVLYHATYWCTAAKDAAKLVHKRQLLYK
jgi:hypothetical protein